MSGKRRTRRLELDSRRGRNEKEKDTGPGHRAHPDADIRSGLPCGDRDRGDGRKMHFSSSEFPASRLHVLADDVPPFHKRLFTGTHRTGCPVSAPVRTASLEELVDHINRSGENQPKAGKGKPGLWAFQARPDQPVSAL